MRQSLRMLFAVALLPFAVATTSCGQGSADLAKRKPITLSALSCETDSLAGVSLGDLATALIHKPDKIAVYQLVGYEKVPDDKVEVIPHYARERLLGYIDRQHAATLNFILFDREANYTDDSVKVRSMPMPLLELVFGKRKQTVSVVFSFTDFTWTLKSDGKVQFTHNYANKELVNLYFKQFIELTKQQ